MFSVIVPIYNAENTLSRCLDSILCQSLRDFELILVDDGSKDGSGAICDEYASKDDRIRVIHKENGGASSARNAGLDVISGEWVTFCDSDDYVKTHWLSSFVDNICGADLVIQGIDARGNTPETFQHTVFYEGVLKSDAALLNILTNGVLGYTPVKLFRSDTIWKNRIRFDENMKFLEDVKFVLEYFKYIDSVSFVPAREYVYFTPSWDEKYGRSDILPMELLQYESLITNPKLSGDSEALSVYRLHLTRHLFFEYEKANPNVREYLKKYRDLVGRGFYSEDVSFFSKIIYSMPSGLCHSLFLLKARVMRCKKRDS